jgi:hypothetical protein
MSRTESLSNIDEGVVAAAEVDLDRLLAIEPSAEFAAQVRARIAAGAPVRVWRWGRIALTAAVVTALIVAFRLDGLQVGQNARPGPGVRHPDIVLGSTPPAIDLPVVRHTPPAARGGRHVRRPARQAADATEIIIDPSVADAIRRLIISTGKVSLETTSETRSEGNAALTIAEPLDVPELVLKPAEQWGGQESIGLKKE